MNRSREWFQAVAQDTGFRAETLEKATRLGELAAEVGLHPLLGRVLALKGGTALNLAFGPPSRLSVDLDFNYVGAEGREEMLDRRPSGTRSLPQDCLAPPLLTGASCAASFYGTTSWAALQAGGRGFCCSSSFARS